MEAARVLPAVRALAAELAEQAACERTASCVSGNGPGGEGPVFRALSGESRRADAIAAQLDAGSARLAAGFGELGALQEAYQRSLADESLSAQERRRAARAAILQMGQIVGTIAQDDPVALVAGYAAELAQPSGAPVEVERLRQARAGQLHAVAAAVPHEHVAPPPFPASAGVADTLAQVGRFAPIALIIAAVDLVLPISLWLYTFFALRARVARDDPEGDEADPEDRTTSQKPGRAKARSF